MPKTIKDLPTKLNKNNIENTIDQYLGMISGISREIKSDNVIEYFTSIKREKLVTGPYPGVTLFEAANRIMTDLVILKGVKDLLNGVHPKLQFDHYNVEYGHYDTNGFDITVKEEGVYKLKGEAFNVAPSFFSGKKNKMIQKLRKGSSENEHLVLIYNKEAVERVKGKYNPKPLHNEHHIQVDIATLNKRL